MATPTGAPRRVSTRAWRADHSARHHGGPADSSRRSSPTSRLDAIVTGAEGIALLAIDALRSAGWWRVSDVLASYVDSDALAVTDPSVTSLDPAARELGDECMALLAGALEGRIERRVLRSRCRSPLVVRGSTPRRHSHRKRRNDYGIRGA